MRTRTDEQQAVMAVAGGYNARIAVVIYTQLGAQEEIVDLSDVQGRDFIDSVDWDEGADGQVGTATIRLRREVDGLSLAQLVTEGAGAEMNGDGGPVLRAGRLMNLDVQLLGPGGVTSEPINVFSGVIDSVDSGEDMSISCRDRSAALIDTQIEVERTYGSQAGVPIAAVMGQILSDNGLGGFGLTVVGVPNFVLGPGYKVERVPVMSALQSLAQMIGWEIRWRWLPQAGGFGLALYAPKRGATLADYGYSWAAGEYSVKGKVEIDRDTVRNRFVGVYESPTAKDEGNKPLRVTVVREDLPSQALYGVRSTLITEGATSAIDTTAEMNRFLDSGLYDCKDAPLSMSIQVALNPFLELGDVVGLLGPTPSFTSDQQLAVLRVTHAVSGGMGLTRLELYGKPALHRNRWLQLASGAWGNAQAITTDSGPEAPTNLVVTPAVNGFALDFTPAPVANKNAARSHELHLSKVDDFAPTASTVYQVLPSTKGASRFVVNDLPPGQDYFVKVVPVSGAGDRGNESPQTSASTRYVEPRFLQPFLVPGIVPNDSFEANNDPAKPPDTWTLTAGTWGATAFLTPTAFSGANAVRFVGATDNNLASQPVTAREGDVVNFEAMAMRPASTGAGVASLLIEWLDVTFASIGAGSILIGDGAAGVWTRHVQSATAPIGTRFLRVRVNQGSISPEDLIIDGIRVLYGRFLPGLVTPVTAQNGYSYLSVAQLATLTGGHYYVSAGDDTVLEGHVNGPSPATTATAFMLPADLAPFRRRTFTVSTDAGAFVAVRVEPTGAVSFLNAPAGAVICLDGVFYRRSLG